VDIHELMLVTAGAPPMPVLWPAGTWVLFFVASRVLGQLQWINRKAAPEESRRTVGVRVTTCPAAFLGRSVGRLAWLVAPACYPASLPCVLACVLVRASALGCLSVGYSAIAAPFVKHKISASGPTVKRVYALRLYALGHVLHVVGHCDQRDVPIKCNLTEGGEPAREVYNLQ
jgi:hypothetical protein